MTAWKADYAPSQGALAIMTDDDEEVIIATLARNLGLEHAAQIVREHNSHDPLLEALEAAADDLDDAAYAIYRAADYMPDSGADMENGESFRGATSAHASARAAIAKATGLCPHCGKADCEMVCSNCGGPQREEDGGRCPSCDIADFVCESKES